MAPTTPGDCNVNGAVDLPDHAAFVDCMFGPDEIPFDTCPCFDVDGNGTVDLADFAEIQNAFILD